MFYLSACLFGLKLQKIDKSGKIIKLDRYCPWKDHLFELEREMNLEQRPASGHGDGDTGNTILYCLYQDDREKKWRIMSVPTSEGSFNQRKPLPAQWRGLRGPALDAVTDVPGGTFVHIAGFTGGA